MEYNKLRKLSRHMEVTSGVHSKIAFLGNYSTQYLANAVGCQGKISGVEIESYEGGFNQLNLEILNKESELYFFEPDVIFLAFDSKVLKNDFYKLTQKEKSKYFITFLSELDILVKVISNNLDSKILFPNLIEDFDDIFNFLYSKNPESFLYQLQMINCGLNEIAAKFDDFFVMDLKGLSFKCGIDKTYSNKLFVNTSQPYELNFIPVISKSIMDFILNFQGQFTKCLILDLDNTLWGGVIGDDGMNKIEIGDLGVGKIFTEIQLWAKALKNRGVILCICSKNTESIAKEPFEKLGDMVLNLDDISVFVANWNNKADNIRYIKEVLNIGYDSMVFVDDNPAEREMVRSQLSDVIVPELPEDAANYVEYLNELNLFSTVSYSALDKDRTSKYKDEAKRVKFKDEVDIDTYLRGLEMTGECTLINDLDVSRVSQLTQRSNQFNLRTIRMSESEVKSFIDDDKKFTLKISLKDKFGDYGLIGLVMIEERVQNEFFIVNWIMSCRVLKRGVENFTFNSICDILKEKSTQPVLFGEYIPTAKNVIVSEHYLNLGFLKSEEDLKFKLVVNESSSLGHSIKVNYI